MALNKKQKKQLDLEQEKLNRLRQRLAGAKRQVDDPQEVPRLEREIAEVQARMDKIRQQA